MQSRLPPRVRPHVTRGPARARPLRPPDVERHAPAAPAQEPTRTPLLLRFVRYGIPGLSVLAGAVTMCFGSVPALIAGAGLIGAGVAIWLISLLYRVGVEGDRARDTEERARRYFERTGRWPGQ